jgi:hypothetical protein
VDLTFLETEEEAPASEKATPIEAEAEAEAEEVDVQAEVEIETEEEQVAEEVNLTNDEPEFVVNFPEVKEEPKEEKEDIPFEIKNPPTGEQLGLF